MKKMYVFIAAITCFITSCSNEASREAGADNRSYAPISIQKDKHITSFENNLALSECKLQQRGEQKIIQLYGYRAFTYHGADSAFVSKLWSYYKKNIANLKHFLVLEGKVRIYFPLKNAIVKEGLTTIYADSLGRILVNGDDLQSLKIKGRLKTTKSIKTYFSRAIYKKDVSKEGKAVFFDFGEKSMSMKATKNIKLNLNRTEDVGGISCVKNHGGKNCTVAFDVWQGRCTVQHDRCMDYNGFGTDCSGSHLYFVGSDCSVAMALGECWNESM